MDAVAGVGRGICAVAGGGGAKEIVGLGVGRASIYPDPHSGSAPLFRGFCDQQAAPGACETAITPVSAHKDATYPQSHWNMLHSGSGHIPVLQTSMLVHIQPP